MMRLIRHKILHYEVVRGIGGPASLGNQGANITFSLGGKDVSVSGRVTDIPAEIDIIFGNPCLSGLEHREERNRFCVLLRFCEGAYSHASDCSWTRFEAQAHRSLMDGGSFRRGRLENGEESGLQLGPWPSDMFSDLANCRGETYYIPWSKTQTCIEALVPGRFLFQMTFLGRHPNNGPRTAEICRRKELHSVVPSNMYEQFREQRIDRAARLNLPLVQYVVSVDTGTSWHNKYKRKT